MNQSTHRLIILAVVLVAAAALAGTESLLIIRLSEVATSGRATIGGPFTLVATNGQTVSDRTYRGKWVLTYFGYTSCPDACPTALTDISIALEKLGTDAGKMQPLFVTVDPQRDTRKIMSEYLKSFDPQIIGLTGTKDQIDSVIKEYHLYVSKEKSDSDSDNYFVSHSSYIYLMDPQGTFVDVTQGGAAGEDLAPWLRKEMTGADR